MDQVLLLATTNPGKIRELKALLGAVEIPLIEASELSINLEVDEVGSTYYENALLKARAYSETSGKMVLADDSGLEVDALDGAPGIYSARFSPKANANDADRRSYLLKKLAGLPQPWKAHFHCTAVLVTPDGGIHSTEGRCDGIIIPEERGSGGFGYDPVFYLPEYDATMAELSPQVKNQISHRARAVTAMLAILREILAGE